MIYPERGIPLLLPAPKSSGLDYFNRHWLQNWLTDTVYRPQDVQATLLELTARSLAGEIQRLHCAQAKVLLCGGGAHNSFLVERLEQLLGSNFQVGFTSDFGVDADYCEAMAFAWLAYRHKTGLAGNITSVTGAKKTTILGGFYPAA